MWFWKHTLPLMRQQLTISSVHMAGRWTRCFYLVTTCSCSNWHFQTKLAFSFLFFAVFSGALLFSFHLNIDFMKAYATFRDADLLWPPQLTISVVYMALRRTRRFSLITTCSCSNLRFQTKPSLFSFAVFFCIASFEGLLFLFTRTIAQKRVSIYLKLAPFSKVRFSDLRELSLKTMFQYI